ncbi:hypothetical protein AB2B41_14860 [Marimonas sp. MJW-29]|uniref:DUF1344 domain-containing protein n=1 Tax=Sulfitobacter sediminis TaxID=3234186 RepID=A0ABV3RS63_9RHOB
MVRFALPLAFLTVAVVPALADEVTGTVLAFDRVDRVIVLDDKSVFNVANVEIVPEGLKAGDTITIDYQSDGENGVKAIRSITKN